MLTGEVNFKSYTLWERTLTKGHNIYRETQKLDLGRLYFIFYFQTACSLICHLHTFISRIFIFYLIKTSNGIHWLFWICNWGFLSSKNFFYFKRPTRGLTVLLSLLYVQRASLGEAEKHQVTSAAVFCCLGFANHLSYHAREGMKGLPYPLTSSNVLPCTIIKMKLLICKKILATISLKTGSAISNANTLNISLIKALYFNLDTDWRAKTRRHLQPCVVLECVLVHYSEHCLLTLSTTKQVSWEIPKSLSWFCLQKQLCLVICLDAWIATQLKFGACKKVSWQVYSSLLSWKDTKRAC